MTKITQEKNDLEKNISEMKNGSIEEMLLIALYCLKSYFKSLIAFGKDSKVTKDNINIIREMFKILRTERTLLNYILKSINEIDINAAHEVVKMLDDLNDDTVCYYYDLINDIEDAAELGQEFRGFRPRKEFPTLLKDDKYLAEVMALRTTMESIKNYLAYDNEFWEFIKKRTKIIDTAAYISSKMSRATPITDDDIVVDLEVLVPKVNNLESAKTAIRIFTQAHNIYEKIGSPIEELEISDYNVLESDFSKSYLIPQAKQILK